MNERKNVEVLHIAAKDGTKRKATRSEEDDSETGGAGGGTV